MTEKNPLTELLRPHVAALKASAAMGNQAAQQVIDLYQMHIAARHDPGAPALCEAAFKQWQETQKPETLTEQQAILDLEEVYRAIVSGNFYEDYDDATALCGKLRKAIDALRGVSDKKPETVAEKIKALREQSGYPMMDCKVALHEAKGDFDAALAALNAMLPAAALRDPISPHKALDLFMGRKSEGEDT